MPDISYEKKRGMGFVFRCWSIVVPVLWICDAVRVAIYCLLLTMSMRKTATPHPLPPPTCSNMSSRTWQRKNWTYVKTLSVSSPFPATLASIGKKNFSHSKAFYNLIIKYFTAHFSKCTLNFLWRWYYRDVHFCNQNQLQNSDLLVLGIAVMLINSKPFPSLGLCPRILLCPSH